MSPADDAAAMPDITYDPTWIAPSEADQLFATLRGTIPWEIHRIKMFGRAIDSPRLSCWIGDPGTDYKYSGTRFAPHPWPATLLPIRERLVRELGVPFNSVLVNLYRDGRDYMGWHSDDEPELGKEPVIASVSLGAERRFVFKRKSDGLKHEIVLGHGSSVVMRARTQSDWKHSLPRAARCATPRINLTVRYLRVAQANSRTSVQTA